MGDESGDGGRDWPEAKRACARDRIGELLKFSTKPGPAAFGVIAEGAFEVGGIDGVGGAIAIDRDDAENGRDREFQAWAVVAKVRQVAEEGKILGQFCGGMDDDFGGQIARVPAASLVAFDAGDPEGGPGLEEGESFHGKAKG